MRTIKLIYDSTKEEIKAEYIIASTAATLDQLPFAVHTYRGGDERGPPAAAEFGWPWPQRAARGPVSYAAGYRVQMCTARNRPPVRKETIAHSAAEPGRAVGSDRQAAPALALNGTDTWE